MGDFPKILFFDIETAGPASNTSDLAIVVCFGYKWAHEDKPHCLTIDEKSLRKFDDRKLLKEACAIFTEADLIVAHYGSVFDRRFIQGRLLINNLPPIPQTKMRDTCFMARSIANFSRNRLGYLCKILNLGHEKLDNGWPGAWFKVLSGDMNALRKMAIYCKGDVLALEDLYNRLKAFDNPHPRLILDRSKCGLCGSDVEYRGIAFVGSLRYRRFVCKNPDCRRWDRERTALKPAKGK